MLFIDWYNYGHHQPEASTVISVAILSHIDKCIPYC